MGALSIALNLFTIILVLFFIFVTFLAFNTRDDMNETWLQTLRRVLSSSDGVNRAILSKPSLYFLFIARCTYKGNVVKERF